MGSSNTKEKKVSLASVPQSPNERYFLTSATIGEGSFSTAVLGVDLQEKKEIVVKIIRKSSEKEEKLTRQECEICLLLSHPNIVKYYDFYETPTAFYLISEYCKGGELCELILKRKYLEEIEAKKYFCSLLSALEYLHTNFIAHRDLKPENIWLSETGQLKLGDFGMATKVSAEKRNTQCGSPGYFAPEIILSDSYYPLISEIWSLGIILYSMLTGEFPFDVGQRYISKIMSSNLELCFDSDIKISKQVKDLLRKMLTVSHESRLTLDEIKKHVWLKDTIIPPLYAKVDNVEVNKVKYIVSLGYRQIDVYRAIFEADVNSIYLGMYHNLTLKDPNSKRMTLRSISAPLPRPKSK